MKKSYETNDLKFGAQETRTEQFLTPDGVASLKTEKSSGAVIIENEIEADSLNPVTGAAVAKAVASASGEVPVIGNSDNGKVLTAVVDGSDKHVEWGDAPKELPASLGTAGQVLAVNAGATGVEWATPQAPAYNPAVYEYGSDASDFMTALLANWSAGKPMMLRVPVSAFSSLTSGRQLRIGGYLFLPLVSVTGNGLTITAIFALTDDLEVFSAKFVIDEDEPAWEGVHTNLDQ